MKRNKAKLMIRNIFYFLALSAVCLSCSAFGNEKSVAALEAGEAAVMKLEPEKAESIFKSLFNDENAPLVERAEAGQKLARFIWHVYGRLDEARFIITETLSFGDKKNQSYLTLSRIEREAGNYLAARETAELARREARTRFETHDARLAFSKAALDEALQNILYNPTPNIDQAASKKLLQTAFAMVDTLVSEEPGGLLPSEALLGLSLLLQNGSRAYDAWQLYHHIPRNAPAPGALHQPGEVLGRLLPKLSEDVLSASEGEHVVLALAASGFYKQAVLAMKILFPDSAARTPKINDVEAYFRYTQDVGRTTISFYKNAVSGKASKSGYNANLEKLASGLWEKLHWPDGRPRFLPAKFYTEIRDRFNTVVRLSTISGFYGLNMGQVVIDEEREVEQYGGKAKLRYIALDLMVSNGFTSWFWDGRAATGGWANSPKIFQIRSAYADGGISAWRFVADSLKQEETARKIARFAAADDSLARETPHAYLPGLVLRIRRKALNRIMAELRAQGLEGVGLREVFIAENNRRRVESSIFAHEGRHALDRREFFNFMRSSADKEFYAKLSEVAFSSDPFLAILGGILSSNIGDPSAHGQANERIMKGLVDWIERNNGEVKGFDTTRPALPQLDLLTDDQLREAFRSLDPKADIK